MDKLAFLYKLRSLSIPPVKNLFNVAVQTARQTFPDKLNNEEYAEPNGALPVPTRPQNVHFSDDTQQTHSQRMEHHELNPFNSTNPFGRNIDGTEVNGQECTTFMRDYEQRGYQSSENYHCPNR